MQIILVFFDKKSFQFSGQLVGEIDSFIDANYIRQKRRSEYSRRPFNRSRIESDISYDSEIYEECSRYTEKEESESELLMSVPMPEKAMSLEEELEKVGMSFHDKLFELIGKSGMDNKDVWKRANLDRKHFSKIQCDEKYHPKKKTVMALCIALKLDLEQAKDLLARADWAFSPSSKVDLIVQKAIIAFLESENFEDAIRNAVSLGGDTDTLAAITGSIAEAFYDMSALLRAECRNRVSEDILNVMQLFDETIGRRV